MKKFIYQYKADILLLFTFLLFVAAIEYYYPVAEITWDSDSYIQCSKSLITNTRPIGYSVFLRMLYIFSHSISFIVYSQFTIYFLSILFLLKVINKYRPLSSFEYYLLGVLLLTEPASLYNCITILSDILFASLTYLYLASLIVYIANKRNLLLAVHIFALVCCIETRHIALFYPFFTVLVFIAYSKNVKSTFTNTILVLLVFSCIYIGNTLWNYKVYGVPVYSPFSGWTAANNALYAVPKIKLDPKNIEDPEIRELHTFFSAYLDTTSFKPKETGPDYLWDPRSPLNVIGKHIDDSLLSKRGSRDYTLTWYLLAPKYAKYGSFIAWKFPYEYFRCFIVPNTGTLIKPYGGEMLDYYTAKNEISAGSLERYGLTAGMLYCRKQIFKDHINSINLRYYQARLVLFILSVFYLFIFRKSYDKVTIKILFIFSSFIFLFYFSMLCSSWFMPRYLLAVLSLMTIVIFIAVVNLINQWRHGIKKQDLPISIDAANN